MEEQRRGLKHLIEFLEFAKKSGYMNPGTANNRIRVVREIFNAVPNVDVTDVTKLDIEDIFQRYTVLTTSKLPSSTLRGNKAHLKSSVREFNVYLTDPVHYRPTASRGKKDVSSKTRVEKPSPKKKQPPTEIADSHTPTPPKEVSRVPSLHIDIQVHISPQSSDTQIDKVFESMAKHLKDLYNNTKTTD